MLGAARIARMKREMSLFDDRPPHGITCWMKDEVVGHLEAQIVGREETPYKGGIFTLDIHLPDRYPFEPPKINFVTPIYHPNVDTGGRICLESLKMPPAGAWSPVLNVVTVLTTIQHLMAEPNPDDPLMIDIAQEFKYNRTQYEKNAQLWTCKYAMTDRLSNIDKNLGMDTENMPKSNDDGDAAISARNAIIIAKSASDQNVLKTDHSLASQISIASETHSDTTKQEPLKKNDSSSPQSKRKRPNI